ncbi:hypothetical protein AVEN_21822-1 [Araneus ventricosus]|uniref:Uncharacterized protein n=1 Tax=Araneus ventricosus TaxID=182803 RepID=A0A4Y2P3F2_ARAVE|nr:hypothetical protein AVEN_21822-1 [Araneus ventricosus]
MGILKLVDRYDECLNVGGDYVEKRRLQEKATKTILSHLVSEVGYFDFPVNARDRIFDQIYGQLEKLFAMMAEMKAVQEKMRVAEAGLELKMEAGQEEMRSGQERLEQERLEEGQEEMKKGMIDEVKGEVRGRLMK